MVDSNIILYSKLNLSDKYKHAKFLTSTEIACVASVSSRGSSRKLGQEQKNMNDGEGGGELPL